ncbi:hypothetical protein M422DRAFT_55843 [Sphaerobolus stellatus SS14]|uniref:Uncharacterized protein n=1 Tax=Sphaerobolus stellatus (strain SS14) TaxID=990650 RepID=A0A0C9T9H1_SPHS4|nr:hypothetical protein M422DRAFT_55843 [Sphaerobolus stellatus SS14]
MSKFGWRTWIVFWGEFNLRKLVSDGWNLDALAIYLCASTQCDRAETRRPNREFNVMIELLNCHSNQQIKLNEFSVWALVDSIASWGAEFGEISMRMMRPSVTACLLKLLMLPYNMGDDVTRAIGVALGVFALNYKKEELIHYLDEERRRTDAQTLLVRSVLKIMKIQLWDETSRYSLNMESFEVGGMVLCRLLVDNNAPTPWPDGTSVALLGILEGSQSENLTCKVLETFRRLLSFDGQNNLPALLSSITPLLEPSFSLQVQIKTTQVIAEMMHWRQHREAILHHDGVILALVKNLESTYGELSNASSLALIDFSRHPQAMELMVQRDLARALQIFFSSTNASRHNLAHWSWLFIQSPSSIRQFWGRHYNEFRETFLELCNALEYLAQFEDDDKPRSLDVPSSPSLPKQDLHRAIRTLRHICSDSQIRSEGSDLFLVQSEMVTEVDSLSISSSKHSVQRLTEVNNSP